MVFIVKMFAGGFFIILRTFFFSNLFVSRVAPAMYFAFWPQGGPLYSVYILTYLLIFMYSLWLNLRKLEKYLKIPWGLLLASVLLMAGTALLGGFSLSAIVPILRVVFSNKPFALPAGLPSSLKSALSIHPKGLNLKFLHG